MNPHVTAVILAFGDEPWLLEAVKKVLASKEVDVDLIVVDNGCTSNAVGHVAELPRVKVIRPEENTGYAGGCVLGAAEATGDYLAFVNSDAEVSPFALRRMADVAAEPAVGFAMGSIRLADRPDVMNTAGNPIHYLGLVWAGSYGEPAAAFSERRSVPCGSGCAFVIRRSVWEQLGGFAPEFFAYHEDTDLSLKCWERSLSVEFVPDAEVLHHYEFSRNKKKMFLLERNRLLVLLTHYQNRTLALLAPMIFATEVLFFAAAVVGGWGKEKLKGWQWLWQNRAWISRQRANVQHHREMPDASIAQLMTANFDPRNTDTPPGVGIFNLIAKTYWWLVRPMLPRKLSKNAPRAHTIVSQQ